MLSKGEGSLTYSICQCLWCKYSRQGQFQAMNMSSLSMEWERRKYSQRW